MFACGVGCGSLGIREDGCSERLLSAACSVRFADGDVSLAMLVGSDLRFGAVSCWIPVGGGLTDDTMLRDPIGVGPNAVASMVIRAYAGAESASKQVLAAAMSVYNTLLLSLSKRPRARRIPTRDHQSSPRTREQAGTPTRGNRRERPVGRQAGTRRDRKSHASNKS